MASVLKILGIFRPTNILATGLLAAMAYGGWWVYRYSRRIHEGDHKVEQLQGEVQALRGVNAVLEEKVGELREKCAELNRFVENLTTESRVAEFRILQRVVRADGVPVYTIEFKEFGRDGKPLPSRVFDVPGREVYFDALVIKFSDEEVKRGDPLRGKSLHLFRRIFGEHQRPVDGFLVCTRQKDGVPDLYRVSAQPSPFERRLWRMFWHWAEHPKDAADFGVRTTQIEAPAIRPVVDAIYRMTLEHDGGLNIKRIEPKK